MFSSIISFASSPIGGLVSKIIGGIALAGIVFGLYSMHNAGIRREAIAEHNRRQLEQVVLDQERFIRELQSVNNLQLETLGALQRQNDIVTSRLRRVTQYLESPQAQAGNRPSSDVLRNTVRQISEP
jgi:uncharacterized transporter YbjL